MSEPKPFTVSVPDERLEWIRRRVADFEWHEMPENGGWAYGTNLDYMRELARYWLENYDWRKHEQMLNRLPQFLAEVDGETIHFYHERGSGPSPMPLVISHGWPGSVYEFLHVIEPLAHPERFGGSEEDAFDVIVPSLPGYGWSGKPKNPVGPRRVAELFGTLMESVLGYDSYLAQGGDWGSAISTWMGRDRDACRAIHLNMVGIRPPGEPETDAEKEWASQMKVMMDFEGAYFRLQATKPQTLSYAMMDSPVGVAAWIVEKWNTWSDTEGDDVESRYTKDQLLTNVMIYLVTRTFNTASWMYRGLFEEGAGFGGDDRIETPTGIAHFPRDTWKMPPRSLVERIFNVVHWTDMPRGGHFAAMEEPDLFVEDLRKFATTTA